MGAWRGHDVLAVAEREASAFEAWRLDPDAVPGNGDESLRALIERVGAWLDDLDVSSRRVLVVVDATVIRAAIVRVLDVAPAAFWRFDIRPLSLTVVQRTNGPWQLRSVGCDLRR